MPIVKIPFLSSVSTTIIIVLCTVIPVGLVLAFFSFILISHKHAKRRYVDLKNQYDYFHTQLTSDCKVMVDRLKSLGKFNNNYSILYDERSKQYQELIGKRDKNMSLSLLSLSQLLNHKQYKDAKEVIRQDDIDIKEFIKAVSGFSEDLTSLLRDDTDTREAPLSDKEKYRKIKEFYNTNINELRPLARPFDVIFLEADKTFSKYDKLTDEAKFKEAKALLPELDKILTAVLSVMNDLPALETLANSVIPQKISDLNAYFEQLTKEGYTLDFLKVPQTIEEMNDRLYKVKQKLYVLDISGVSAELGEIQSGITDMTLKFEEEKKAKLAFLENQETISYSSFALEKSYATYMNELPDYQKTFVLDIKYVNQMIALKNDIEAIGYLKRGLDSYVDAGNKQPYSLIMTKITSMKHEIKKVTETMKEYSDYISGLKKDSQDLFLALRDYYLKLKKAQYKVTVQIAVQAYTKVLDARFQEVYDTIVSLDHIVLTQPVDTVQAKTLFVPFQEKADALIKEIDRKEEECEKAEAAILYANAYRVDYVDSHPMLDVAEKAFLEGDFDRAQSAAVQVVRTFSSRQSNTASQSTVS